VTAGFKSRAQVIRERGGNPQDVFEQIKQERNQEKEAGISFSTSSPPKQTQLSLFNEGEPDEKQTGTANKDV
jgi:capsid protein